MNDVLSFLRFLVEAPEGRVWLVLGVVFFAGVGGIGWRLAGALRKAVEGQGQLGSIFSDPNSPFMQIVTGLINRLGDALDKVGTSTDSLVRQATATENAQVAQVKAMEALVSRLETRFDAVNTQHTDMAEGISGLRGALKTLEENQAVMQATVERLAVLCEQPDAAVISCLEELDRKMCEVLAEIARVRTAIEASVPKPIE